MKRISKRLLAGILVIALAIGVASGYIAYNSYAARTIDESKTVTFAAFSARHDVPQTTIFIGTHLIVLESATDELWEKAVESQTQSGQETIYYKSELTNGTWFDITDAQSLRDISGEGTPVSESELADLLVMYYTFTYGVTRLAINDMRHCIFDGEYDYWDLYHLSELEELSKQYDIIVSRNNDKSRMDNFYREFLGEFFSRDLRNSVTQRADDALYALQDVYDALVAAERIDDSKIIYRLMAKLDNARRAEIFRQLADEEEETQTDENGAELTPLQKALKAIFNVSFDNGNTQESASSNPYINVLDEIMQRAEGTGYDEDDEFITNYDVVDAIGSGNEECITSYQEKSTGMLEIDGSRVIDQLIYDISKSIIDNASGGLTTTMDSDIARLGHLLNIDDEKIVKQDEELAIVDNELMGPVTDKFAKGALAKQSEEYDTALNAGASEAALSNLLDIQEYDLDAVRLELQDVIKAKTDRMKVDEGMAFTYDRINLTQDILNQIPQSDFMGNARIQVKKHIKWLTDLLSELYERAKSGESELDQLMAEADNLLLQQQKALDNNDYKKAKEFGAARDALLSKIDDLINKLKDIMDNPNASAGDKALAQAVLNGGYPGLDQLLQKITDGLIDSMNNGDDISDGIDLLKTLGATDSLNKLKEEAAANGNEQALNQVNEALDDFGGNDNDDNGMTEDELLTLLSNILGDINSLSADQLGSAIRAMEMIYDMGYENAGSLAARLASIAKTKGNKYVYNRINDSTNYEYVRIATLAHISGYRLAYDNDKRVNTLIGSNPRVTYQFRVGSRALYKAVYKETKEPEFVEHANMADNVLSNGELFATVDAAKDYFDCVACHIKKSNYGICITSKMEGEAESLRDELLQTLQGAN